MMQTTSNYLLWRGDQWDLLVLPYDQENQELQLAMAILLPKETDIKELERNFTWENWQQGLSKLQMETVSLILPRFRIEDRIDLNTVAKSLGLTLIFSPEADFSGMTGQKGIYVNKAIHKTFVRVDEKGTDASGAMAGLELAEELGREAPYKFIADHPFIFVIWDQKTESILFMGRLSLP